VQDNYRRQVLRNKNADSIVSNSDDEYLTVFSKYFKVFQFTFFGGLVAGGACLVQYGLAHDVPITEISSIAQVVLFVAAIITAIFVVLIVSIVAPAYSDKFFSPKSTKHSFILAALADKTFATRLSVLPLVFYLPILISVSFSFHIDSFTVFAWWLPLLWLLGTWVFARGILRDPATSIKSIATIVGRSLLLASSCSPSAMFALMFGIVISRDEDLSSGWICLILVCVSMVSQSIWFAGTLANNIKDQLPSVVKSTFVIVVALILFSLNSASGTILAKSALATLKIGGGLERSFCYDKAKLPPFFQHHSLKDIPVLASKADATPKGGTASAIDANNPTPARSNVAKLDGSVVCSKPTLIFLRTTDRYFVKRPGEKKAKVLEVTKDGLIEVR
jgi:hypothetical protein